MAFFVAQLVPGPVAFHRTCLVALLLLAALNQQAAALVVGPTLNTTVNPADYGPAWTQGDPGWENVSVSGPNYVYLGDSWVLTARHVGIFTAHLSSGSFSPIPNQSYIIRNPPPSLAGGMQLTDQTDLYLFRINGAPDLPSLTISSESPPLAGASGSEIMFVGNGPTRFASETHWNVVDTGSPWVWTETADAGNYQGFKTFNQRTKRWGTNRLASAFDNLFSRAFDRDGNPNDTPEALTNTTGVLALETNGVTRDVISLASEFSKPSDSSATAFEAQGAAQPSNGNSGSAVFYNRNGTWELAGIVNSVLTFNNQPTGVRTAVYGNATTFADLSYYNQDYTGSIADVIESHREYSIIGDLNLDGDVTGDGTGPVASDDVAAFIQGWNYEQEAGDITSWKKGDLNLDGRTDVSDFLLFRNTLNGTASGAALATLMSGVGGLEPSAGVPEPASAALLLIGIGAGFAISRRRR